MKKMIIGLIAILFICSQGYAQNCNAGARVADRVWAHTGGWTNPVSFVPFANMFKVKKTVWNGIVGNSSATWGPRNIVVDKKEFGTVQAGTKRTFVSNPLFYNKAKITINKTGGRGRTVVLVCTHDSFGNSEAVREYEFANSGLSSSKVFHVPNVRGKIVSVAISCKTAFRSFTYDAKLENFDPPSSKR